MKPKQLSFTPQELDSWSKVKISRWLDINSQECRECDLDLTLAKKWLKMGVDGNFLFVDRLGRVWGQSEQGFYPYHFEYGKELIGYRLSQEASN